MSLTLFALFILPIHLALVLCPAESKNAISKLLKESHTLVAYLMMFLALIIFLGNGFSFKLEWTNLINWLGLLIWLKALIWLFLPSWPKKMFDKISENILPALGFLALLFDLALIFIDTKLI